MYSVSTFFRLIQYKREGMQLHFHISRHIAHLGWETPVFLTLFTLSTYGTVAENSEAASFLGQTTSFETEVQEREPWDFYEWITCNEKPRCAPNIFPHNVLAGNINRWKNITADGLFRKNGTTTI